MDNTKAHAIKDSEKSLYRYFGEIGNILRAEGNEQIVGDHCRMLRGKQSKLKEVLVLWLSYTNYWQ